MKPTDPQVCEVGEVVVRVNQFEASGSDIVVRFEVADTGDGIAADKLDTIFQPFVQADSSTSRKYGGTGLGLAISSQLVGLMGGRCGVSSRLAEGSTFWFTVTVHADIRDAITGSTPCSTVPPRCGPSPASATTPS